MKILHIETMKPLEGESAVALGFFDGIHMGHQKIFEVTVNQARQLGIPAATINLIRHPIEVLNPDLCFPYLTTVEEKVSLERALGIDLFIEAEFTKEFAATEPEDFVKEVLLKKLKGRVFVLGRDYRFGKRAKGNVELLRKLASESGAKVIVVEDFTRDGLRISSTDIREAILLGEIERANGLLGRWYSIAGTVIGGNKRGRKMGIPTANVNLPSDKTMPRPGVYAVCVMAEGKTYRGICHLGDRPTFNESSYNIETHLFNFDGDLYDKDLRVFFVHYIRPTKKFNTPSLMMEQISIDVDRAWEFFKGISDEEIEKNSGYFMKGDRNKVSS